MLKTVVPFLLVAAAASAQQEIRMAFSEENRPRLIRADLLNGRITVRGYDGKDAIISGANNDPKYRAFTIIENNNVITIHGGHRDGPITIQTPFETSLQLRCTNCAEIRVDNIKGNVDASSTNGALRLYGISGSILANTTNDRIVAVMDYVDPTKPSSFISMNGTIETTFPRDLKANVRMRTENGNIHSDYDIRLAPGPITRTDRGLVGTIGGGGPEIQFKAFNGSIHIRRK